jgi:glycine/D-amino acid oxidase-like deaminating enzyme
LVLDGSAAAGHLIAGRPAVEIAGAALDREACRVGPGLVWRALAARLHRTGATFRLGALPARIALRDGHVTGIELDGDLVDCDALVVTEPLFLDRVQAAVPLSLAFETSIRKIAATCPVDADCQASVESIDGRLDFWQLPDGEIAFAGPENPPGAVGTAGRCGAPSAVAAVMLQSLMPQLNSMKCRWLGEEKLLRAPDGVPVLGEAQSSGIYLAAGWGAAALALAPFIGRSLADRAAGETLDYRLDRLAPDRFPADRPSRTIAEHALGGTA